MLFPPHPSPFHVRCRACTAPLLVLILLSVTLLPTLYAPAARAGTNLWTSSGLLGAFVRSVVIDPTLPQTLYASVQSLGVFKTVDGGTTWTNTLKNLDAPSLAIDPSQPQVVYALSANDGFYRSRDRGESWLRLDITLGGVTAPPCGTSIAVSPLDSNLLLATLAPVFGYAGCAMFPAGEGLYRSVDGGLTWQRVAAKMPAKIQFAPSAPHIVYAVGTGVLLRSSDSGQTWQEILGSFVQPPDAKSLAVDPGDAQVVYFGTGFAGLYKSPNGGATWVPITGGLGSNDINSLVIHTTNQQVLYAAGGSSVGSGMPGVYRSLDNGGQSWGPFMAGMDSRAIFALAIDSSTPPNLYAGTYSGIWKYTLASEVQDYSISIDDGALYTNAASVVLSLTAPPDTDAMLLSNDGGFAGATWEPLAATRLWTLTSVGNTVLPRVVYAKFRTSGSTSGLYQDDIVLDTTPPIGSVTVVAPLGKPAQLGMVATDATRAQAAVTVYLPFIARARDLRLQLVVSDDLSGVNQMMISELPTFAGASWERYATQRIWPVSNQARAIYVRYQDRAGNSVTASTPLAAP